MSSFRLSLFVLCVLFLQAIFAEDTTTSFTLVQPDDEAGPEYNIQISSNYDSFGELKTSSDGKSCDTIHAESRNDVFFDIKKNNQYCTIYSGFNPITNERTARVYAMQGTFCSIMKDAESRYSIASIDNHLVNCQWNGNECVEEAEGLKVNFQLDGAEFKLSTNVDFPWLTNGGRSVVQNSKNAYTVLTLLTGFIYLNVTTDDGSSWCLVSSEAHLRDYHAMSLIYAAHNAFCTSEEISHHNFKITAQKLQGAECIFDGLDCKIAPELLETLKTE